LANLVTDPGCRCRDPRGGWIFRVVKFRYRKNGVIFLQNWLVALATVPPSAFNSKWGARYSSLLTPSQFADGIALGQITPGPVLIMSALCGLQDRWLWCSCLDDFCYVLPSFAMTLIFTEVFSKLKIFGWSRCVECVLASFVGLLAVVVLQLAKTGITGQPLWRWQLVHSSASITWSWIYSGCF